MNLRAQVEISKAYGKAEWREDLKSLMRRTGCDGKRVMFLFSDTQVKRGAAGGCSACLPALNAREQGRHLLCRPQIKEESFIEDINNLLNSGEVPNMFATDEKMQVSSRRLWAAWPLGVLACWRASQATAPIACSDHGGCAPSGCQGWSRDAVPAMELFCIRMSITAAHCAGDEPHRQRATRAAACQPVAGQLLHH